MNAVVSRLVARMSTVLGALLVVVLLGSAACRKHPEAEVNAALDQAIAQLEGHDYKGFLERWPAPEDRRQLLTRFSMDEAIHQFEGAPAAKLMAKLKKARAMPPVWNGDEASFLVDPNAAELVMVRIDGRYHIRN